MKFSRVEIVRDRNLDVPGGPPDEYVAETIDGPVEATLENDTWGLPLVLTLADGTEKQFEPYTDAAIEIREDRIVFEAMGAEDFCDVHLFT